jgi:hypothetical protein
LRGIDPLLGKVTVGEGDGGCFFLYHMGLPPFVSVRFWGVRDDFLPAFPQIIHRLCGFFFYPCKIMEKNGKTVGKNAQKTSTPFVQTNKPLYKK